MLLYQLEGPSTRCTREARLSAAVHDPKAVETTPGDDKPVVVVVVVDEWQCERYLFVILSFVILMLLLKLWLAS